MLHNTSYKVDFKFENGIRTTTVESANFLSPVLQENIDSDVAHFVYYALQNVLDDILIGGISWNVGDEALIGEWTIYTDPGQNIQYTALMACPEIIFLGLQSTTSSGTSEP